MIAALRSPLLRLLFRAAWGPAWSTAGLAALLLTLASLGQVLLASSVTPAPSLLARMVMGVVGAVAPLVLAVGALAGAAGGTARLREEHGLTALAAAGLRPRRLAGLVAVLLVPAAVAHAALAHVGEPLARALLRDTRAAAAAAVVAPAEGRPVRLGSWWLALDDGVLVFTDGAAAGQAAGWELSPREGGVVAELSGATVRLAGGQIATAARLSLPLPVVGRGREHVSEKTTPELVDQLRVSAHLGRDGYERWLLWKRTLLAAMIVPLGLAAAGFARRAPAGAVVSALLFGAWVSVRLSDARVEPLGAPAAAAGLFAGACATAGWAWRR